VAFARYTTPVMLTGQVFAIFVMMIAAAEAAVGLALVLSVYRNMRHIQVDDVRLLKW